MLQSLWRYRWFVISNIHKELKLRFSRSRIGGVWLLIHPLVQISIYAILFSQVFAPRIAAQTSEYGYVTYLMSGMLAWSLFNDIVTRCTSLFVEQGNLMKKMSFPRVTLPATVVGVSLTSNIALFVTVVIFYLITGHPIGWFILWILPLTLIIIFFALGLGLIFGILNVFIRDVGQVVPIFIQILFWLTPIAYPIDILPDVVKPLIILNPLYGIIDGYHHIMVLNVTPAWINIGYSTLASITFLALSLFMFRKASDEMVDAL